jgi:protein-tyrosine kinase
MSRIEQALRNASLQPAPPPPELPDATGLDAYPAITERTPAADRPLAHSETVIEAPATGEADTLIVHEREPRVCTEQFRELAAALHQKQNERGLKTLMITSAHANEGKTFTTANLGLMLSESYRRRVLIIDADLRRPSLHTLFNVNNADGLADGLRNHAREAKVMRVSEWLAVLPGGTPELDPMPSLTSGRLKPIIDEASSKFDWVIIDTPPVALLPDGALVSSMVEAAVLVVGAGITPYRLVHRAVETLGRNKIVGVVLNRVEHSTLPEASYDYYYGQKKKAAAARRRFFGFGYIPVKQ